MIVPVRLLLVLILAWGLVALGVWYLRRSLRTGVVRSHGGWGHARRGDQFRGYWLDWAFWALLTLVMAVCAAYFTTLIPGVLAPACREAVSFGCLNGSAEHR
jgi:hypothetical protein